MMAQIKSQFFTKCAFCESMKCEIKHYHALQIAFNQNNPDLYRLIKDEKFFDV